MTRHTVTVGGEELTYTATAGTILVGGGEDDGAEVKASLFYVAYTLDGADGAQRPVTFAFNGGPGSSSVWLHLGLLGPRRVHLPPESPPAPPPYRVRENGHTLLALSDLVFLDPVSTGYSRAAPGEDPKAFHGVEGDVASVGRFLRRYVTRFRRWASPKFLIGESYGSARAVGLAAHLQDRYGMDVNGVLLISPALDFQTLAFDPGNDLPYLLVLPSYAAVAGYHGRLPPELAADLPGTLREVESFALGEYARALVRGSSLPPAERRTVVEKLSRFTGLAPEYVERSDLRVPVHRFCQELLRDRRRVVGRFDGRSTGISPDPVAAHAPYDPSYGAVLGAFSGAFKDYVRRELAFETQVPYEILNARRVQPWDYGPYQNRYVSLSATLRRALAERPFLRVFLASGRYDLATPYLCARYTVEHLNLEPAQARNLTLAVYEGGHMMYTDPAARERLAGDLAAFVRDSVPHGED
ncbi:MAG: peptidase S10 [Thermodesulfobacteriota bacterium]